MSVYKGKIEIPKEDFKWYKKLLSLDLEDEKQEKKIEELEARKDDYFVIDSVEFENGNVIDLILASGRNNYYDNIVLFDKNGCELWCNDCYFDILKYYEIFYDEDIYEIDIKVV